MDRIERISQQELETLGLQKLAGAVIKVAKLDGTIEIARVPEISLQDFARSANLVQDQ